MKLLSCVRLFATPWTVAYQAPPSMVFSRQEYWSGLPFLSPGDLPGPGIEPRSPAFQADALTSEPPGKPKERQRQRMFKLLHNYTHFNCQQGNTQNLPRQASVVLEQRTSRCTSWIYKLAEGPEIKLPTSTRLQKKKASSRKPFCFIDYAKAFDCVDHNELQKILKEIGIPDYLICLLRNLYAGQEATVRTGHGTTDWFQIGRSTSWMYIFTLLI